MKDFRPFSATVWLILHTETGLPVTGAIKEGEKVSLVYAFGAPPKLWVLREHVPELAEPGYEIVECDLIEVTQRPTTSAALAKKKQ